VFSYYCFFKHKVSTALIDAPTEQPIHETYEGLNPQLTNSIKY